MAQPIKHRQRTGWGRGRLLGVSAVLALTAGACIGKIGPDGATEAGGTGSPTTTTGTGGAGGGPYMEKFPYEHVSARIYVSKVKNLLIGQAATEDEIAAVEKDPAALHDMVHKWFVKPEAQDKLFSFFQKAFQQTQIGVNDFVDQGGVANNKDLTILTAAKEMFARTVLDDIAQGKPFTNTVTTHQFMMTPALMSFYLYVDQTLVDDANKTTPNVPKPDGTLASTIDSWATYIDPMLMMPITLDQVLDPKSPRYMHFPVPAQFGCNMPVLDGTGHVSLDAMGKVVTTPMPYSERQYAGTSPIFAMLFGTAPMGGVKASEPQAPPIPADVLPADKGKYAIQCDGQQNYKSTLTTAEDLKWRLVTVRAPMPGEKLIPFYDLKTLRLKSEIVARMPRVGFFSTPAFFANWQTNKSNEARDAMNQTLVVAIGTSINPVDKGTSTVLDTGKDGEHSDPMGPCYSCHQTMDPMRLIFRKAFTYTYHIQQDTTYSLHDGKFDFLGEKATLTTLDDLATALVNHPHYSAAWVQKLCYYANSDGCSEDDPEFIRIAKAFTDSNYDFHTLVDELFSSPIITGAEKTKTRVDFGETVSISRQDHLCASLTNRLKLSASVCGTIANPTQAQAVANNIPSDGYLRGAEAPALSTDPTLFFRGAGETICQIAADIVVDKAPMSLYSSAKKDQAITDFVGNIMGLGTGDPTSAPAMQILQDHYDAAILAKATPTDALKSTFVLACTSPTSLAMGL
ncbi:MAG: hypothetical protein ABJE95_01985 [Byssovorax sp.]